jgi:hypothetical protein
VFVGVVVHERPAPSREALGKNVDGERGDEEKKSYQDDSNEELPQSGERAQETAKDLSDYADKPRDRVDPAR